MKFTEAFELMKKGTPMKLPAWGGYWVWDPEKKTIMMHCRKEDSDTGKSVLDIRETQRVEYTLSNLLSEDWVPATSENTTILGGTPTFGFGDALKYLKRGLRVTRQGWNGKEQFLFLVEGETLEYATNANLAMLQGKEIYHPDVIAIKTTKGDIQVGWLASQTDMLAEDWMFVE